MNKTESIAYLKRKFKTTEMVSDVVLPTSKHDMQRQKMRQKRECLNHFLGVRDNSIFPTGYSQLCEPHPSKWVK